MGLASQEYHSFLTRQQGGNESNQDDHAEIAALRERIRHMEKVDAQRAKQRAQQHAAATRDAAELSRRMAADAARQEELAQLKATVAARIQENKERLRRRLEEEQLGKSNSPGALATGDVWSRGTVSDVVSLINRQNKRRQQLAAESDQFVAKGLPLLGSVKMRSAAERVSVQDSQLQAADRAQLAIPDNITPEMQLLPGVQKLKFLKIGQLSALAQSISNTQTIPLSTQDHANVSSPAKRIMSNIPDKLLHPPSPGRSFSHSPTGKSFLYDSAPHPRTVEYPTSREITVVSTASNLKYMRVGDAGLADLSRALHRDAVITQLNLSSARVSCVGAVSLASVLPTMAALRHLDLSCNLVGDAGAQALASALTVAGCRLEKLVLAGNRVQLRGAIALVRAVFDSSVSWMR